MRLYPLARILALPIFLAYMGMRLVIPEISILGELILFNLVALMATVSVLSAGDGPRSARIPITVAIFSWTLGSTVSSWNALTEPALPDWISDAGYLAFYPLLFFGLMSTLRSPRERSHLHLLDSLIVALGLASLISILVLTLTTTPLTISNYEMILKNFYPIADAVLIATTIVIMIRSSINSRNLLIFTSLLVFTMTDLLFLIQSGEGTYRFGSIVDSGWLVALLLLAESQWHRPSERIKEETHPLLSTAIAATGSGLVIAMKIFFPEQLPDGAMVPAFLTLLLAFIRMSLALIEAQRLNEASHLAKTDELTGLANRRKFVEEIAGIERGDFLILIDLNGFKPVNDSYGHGAGDELLKQTGLRLARIFEKEWTFARLGGDEFGLLVKAEASRGRVREIAQAIAAAFSYPFQLTHIGAVKISASIGVAIEDGHGELLRRADLAMYQAKRSGQSIAFWSELSRDATTLSRLTDRR